ncbi:hypothetical protein GCM10023188_11860 [Pontibacter saemangeumensis]|uniref:Lipoprotein n=1 Tax=Pontibacter saemangeumensis TaxID=1084525 RepID=A0ABP8LGL3_9BACT
MHRKRNYILYGLLLLALLPSSCQQGTEEDGTLASTHPQLQEQLAEDSIEMPITDNENPDLYERYRITMEKYRTDGQYAVGDMYRGRLAPLDESSHRDARAYRTAIRKALHEGVNFAGKYTVVTIGCGTGCQTHYVVDRESGRVLYKLQGNAGASFTPDSRLFILNPPDSALNYAACPDCAPQAYEFRDGKFRKLPEPAP